jgi:putative ABC transport system substrate-binding protein
MHKTLLYLFVKSSSANRKSKIQNRKCVGFIALVVALTFSGAVALAQQPKKVPRIGFLGAASMSANSARIEAFRQGLGELGYMEGKNIVIEYRYADGISDRLPALAAELVGLKVDVIISGGRGATRPAKEATATIPIVMTGDGDPVGLGFVASLARPGGNITGLSTFSPELSGKRLELVKESVSKLSRVAVFGTSATTDTAQLLKEVERAAGALRVKLQYVDVVDPKHINTAFQSASNGGAEALIVLGSAAFIAHRTQVVELAAKHRLPTMYNRREYVETGGLMFYGVNLADLSRRAATYVDKILKGAKPAELPVEQPKKFEFIINLKTAKQIGLTIPPNVLARADRVIR